MRIFSKNFFLGVFAIIAVALAITFASVSVTGKTQILGFEDTTALKAELQKYKDQEQEDQKLGQYAINMMYEAGAKNTLSDARKQILARAIVRVANDIFQSYENKKAFVMMLAIESSFNKYAQSPTGPKGLSQVAKGTFYEAMADCGVTNLFDDDVWETEINLYAGACYFKKLLLQKDGDPFMAIVAYNQGPNSKSSKSYSKNGRMDEIEPLKYVAQFTFLSRTVSDKKEPHIPAIHELPKPTPPIMETKLVK